VFVADVASRIPGRVQISSDALRAYQDAIEQVYGTEVDFAQIVKTYEHDHSQHPEHKYSAPKFVAVDKRAVHETDNPDKPIRHVTILHLGPVDSPLKAVQISILGDRNLAAEES